ncbi:cyclin-like protein [Thamnocephalis sphaerospora]|uniref:Cyclin-like protein n=1 Tax=Thamnocephalis sphaerospora TaxID=78915 RepID=A0A4P9XJE5_9FUNG|nr:cyclin-like protein [Thamnocephalis sphaerospora]|eukprot:RKP05471.1 cyclin-like protein [Thamnocephalis sphaerospora]
MAASYWSSSQRLRWLMPANVALPGHERDLTRVSWADRTKLTLHYTNVIQSVAKRMMLRQRVVASAMTYFQRFYANNAYCETDPYPIACACLYLAAKVEETPHHLRTFVNEMRELLRHPLSARDGTDGKSTTANAARFPYTSADIAELEIYLLEEMDFYMILQHPYDLLTRLCAELQLPQSVLQTAWFVTNDSFRTDACLRYPPHVIALAALYLTCALQPPEAQAPASSAGTSMGTVTEATGGNPILGPGSALPNAGAPVTITERVKDWFAGLSTPLTEIAEVAQRLLAFYHVWDSFHETEDVSAILARLRTPEANAPPTAGPSTST